MIAASPRYWITIHPDIAKPIGGVKQIHRLAESLNANGREATLIQDQADFHPGWFQSNVSTISSRDWKQRQDLKPSTDVVILPETFLPFLEHYGRGLPKLIFNQNGAYSFGLHKEDGFPDNPEAVISLYRNSQLIHTLCVSEHDQHLLGSAFGLGSEKVSCLVNPIETQIFKPGRIKEKLFTYMPRKNSRDAAIVTALMHQQPWFRGWSLQAIDGLPQQQVACLLKKSLGFLSFGHPEGFGLPLAEAGACGCALIGYSGLGGREILAIAKGERVGWEVEYGDWQGFLVGAEALIRNVKKEPKEVVGHLQSLSKQIRHRYSWKAMVKSVGKALPRWESQIGS